MSPSPALACNAESVQCCALTGENISLSYRPVDIGCTEDQPHYLPTHGAAIGDLDEGHDGFSEPPEDASHVKDLK